MSIDEISEIRPAWELVREANDRIRELAGRFGGDEPASFVCECENPSCLETVALQLDEYDARRVASPAAPISAHG
jgi:hypothetical protein